MFSVKKNMNFLEYAPSPKFSLGTYQMCGCKSVGRLCEYSLKQVNYFFQLLLNVEGISTS